MARLFRCAPRRHCLSLAVLSTLALSGCGGGVDADGDASAPSTDTTRHANHAGSHILVKARGTLAANIGPQMEVRVNGQPIGNVQVRAEAFQSHEFMTPTLLPAGAQVDVVFLNDALIDGADRNLYVESVTIDGRVVPATSPTVSYDRGPVDGKDLLPGREDMLWSGALRFTKPTGQSVTVRARGSLAANVGPAMEVRFKGERIGQVNVANSVFQDFTFPLPEAFAPNSTLDVVFLNDAQVNGQDRNLYVESIKVGGTVQTPASPGVTYDRGMVDGVDVVPGRTDMLWTGALRFAIAPVVDADGPVYVDETKIPLGFAGWSSPRLGTHGPLGDSETGDFRVQCHYSHMAKNDPIVYPNQPGASHWHMFFGNTGTDASSTAATLRASGNSTCHGGTLNRSAYWMPAVVDTRTGKPLTPNFLMAYYKTGYSVPQGSIRSAPQGLRMIAGDMMASGRVDSPIRITCDGVFLPSEYPEGKYPQSFPACPASSQYVEVHVPFPQCWDGRNLDSTDHKSHMAYPNGGSGCPVSHPVAIPAITLLARYPLQEGGNEAINHWRMASDHYARSRPGGFSNHADWINGWEQSIMETFVQRCDNAKKNCQNGELGDGRLLAGF